MKKIIIVGNPSIEPKTLEMLEEHDVEIVENLNESVENHINSVEIKALPVLKDKRTLEYKTGKEKRRERRREARKK